MCFPKHTYVTVIKHTVGNTWQSTMLMLPYTYIGHYTAFNLKHYCYWALSAELIFVSNYSLSYLSHMMMVTMTISIVNITSTFGRVNNELSPASNVLPQCTLQLDQPYIFNIEKFHQISLKWTFAGNKDMHGRSMLSALGYYFQYSTS